MLHGQLCWLLLTLLFLDTYSVSVSEMLGAARTNPPPAPKKTACRASDSAPWRSCLLHLALKELA